MATNAIETLTDLIDANKDKMADYDYMRMMDCLKELFEKKDDVKLSQSQKEATLTLRNQQLTERFYEIYTAGSRCSNCGCVGHNTTTCMYEPAIINFEGDADINSFSFSVYIEKELVDEYSHRGIYDVVNFNTIGFISLTEIEDEDIEYIRSVINGKFYYFYKESLDSLLLTDVATSRSMIRGLRKTRINHKNKYFNK
jgi:hypothetical protein